MKCDNCGKELIEFDRLTVLSKSIFRIVPDPFIGIPAEAFQTDKVIKVAHEDCEVPQGRKR